MLINYPPTVDYVCLQALYLNSRGSRYLYGVLFAPYSNDPAANLRYPH